MDAVVTHRVTKKFNGAGREFIPGDHVDASQFRMVSQLERNRFLVALRAGDVASTREVATAKTEPTTSQAGSPKEATVTLRKGERDMLAALCKAHPSGTPRADLMTATGISGKSTFRSYLCTLKKYALAIVDGDNVMVSESGLALNGG